MLDFIYVDEQEAEFQGESFTGICAAIICDTKIDEFRRAYFPKLHDIVVSARGSTDCRTIDDGAFAPLHGVNLLRDLTDEKKLSVIDHLLGSFQAVGGRFLRLSYVNSTLPPSISKDRNQRIQFAVSSFWIMLPTNYGTPFVLVHELDHQALRSGFAAISDQIGSLYKTASIVQGNPFSADYRNLVGHYSAKKNEIGCQLADIAGYLALKSMNRSDGFGSKLANLYEKYKSLYAFDELIWMNALSIEENQAHHGADEFRPHRNWRDLVPSDECDI